MADRHKSKLAYTHLHDRARTHNTEEKHAKDKKEGKHRATV